MARKTRRDMLQASCLFMLQPLAACGKTRNNMENETVLDVVLYSFINRPIIDIYLNGTDIGVAGPLGGTSVITEVKIPFGAQRLSWRLDGPEGTPGNGEQLSIKNKLVVNSDQIPKGTFYMGVYLYPDYTAELTFSKFIPGNSKRGEAIFDELKNGKR